MSRADRVERRLAERELDALLVTDAANLRYLTGFTGSAGYAVVGPGLRRFVTDFRYVERARAEVLDFDRGKARGKRLDIPAGTAVRFEPGDTKTVRLVETRRS